MRPPRVILGAMTFAGQTKKKDAAAMLRAFVASSLSGDFPEVDSASMYGM